MLGPPILDLEDHILLGSYLSGGLESGGRATDFGSGYAHACLGV